MKKLNNKGVTFIELMAAMTILSIIVLFIFNNVTSSIRNNQDTADRLEAFSNSEVLFHHIRVTDSSGIIDALNPSGTEVSVYTSADCANPSSPIRAILEQSGVVDSSYCESIFLPNVNKQYTSGMMELYVFESLSTNFDYIIAGNYPDKLKSYALNYTDEFFSSGLDAYNVDNVVIIVYYRDDIANLYSEVIINEQ